MTQLIYKIRYFPDKHFWDQLAKLPLPKGDYPAMLMMGVKQRAKLSRFPG